MTGQLPPERAMPRDVKARVRQDLLSRLSDPAGRPRSPWTATGLAAAAVVAIVGVVAGGTWLADRGGPDEAAPQSSPTSSTPPAETTSPSPTDTPLPRRDTCATSITRTDGGLGSPGDPVTHWYDTSFATGRSAI